VQRSEDPTEVHPRNQFVNVRDLKQKRTEFRQFHTPKHMRPSHDLIQLGREWKLGLVQSLWQLSQSQDFWRTQYDLLMCGSFCQQRLQRSTSERSGQNHQHPIQIPLASAAVTIEQIISSRVEDRTRPTQEL
jgi:hypothetical protein